MAFCTVEDVEARLQTNNLDDTTVEALIADAQAIIEAEVGRTLESAARQQTFDGTPGVLWLKYTPVTSVTSVVEDGTALTGDAYQSKANGRLIRTTESGYQTAWRTRKPQSIVVNYVGGYVATDDESSSSGDEPNLEHVLALAHLRSLCVDIVARAFRKGAEAAAVPEGAAGAIQSVSLTGSDTVTYATATDTYAGFSQFIFLTDEDVRQLARYKNLPTGFA